MQLLCYYKNHVNTVPAHDSDVYTRLNCQLCFSFILHSINFLYNCVFTMRPSTISVTIQSSTECSILLCKQIL